MAELAKAELDGQIVQCGRLCGDDRLFSVVLGSTDGHTKFSHRVPQLAFAS
jgi:hypothetical protein